MAVIMDIVSFSQWATELPQLCWINPRFHSNRFVTHFELWVNLGPSKKMNIGGTHSGVLKSARERVFAWTCHRVPAFSICGSFQWSSGLKPGICSQRRLSASFGCPSVLHPKD